VNKYIESLIERHQKNGWIEFESYKDIYNYFTMQYGMIVVPNFSDLHYYYLGKAVQKAVYKCILMSENLI
jgi:hypothetical protein